MKKLVVIFGMILLLAVGATAQDKMVRFGLKAGMDLADNYGSDAGGTDMKVGFIGGGFLEYMAAPQIAIQLEALYAMKGTKESTTDAKFKTNYIEIPVLFKYMIPTQGSAKPNLYVGPALGILTSAKIDVDVITASTQTSIDVKDIYKSTDFGIAFGAGLGVVMESFDLMFDVRYTLGLTKIIDMDGYNKYFGYQPGDLGYLTETPDLKNSNLSFMVGVAFK